MQKYPRATKGASGISVEIAWPTKPALPKFVRQMLDSLPHRGEGLHAWLFRTARVLHPYRSPEEIVTILRERTRGESVKAGEIEDAAGTSARYAGSPEDPTPRGLPGAGGPGRNRELRS